MSTPDMPHGACECGAPMADAGSPIGLYCTRGWKCPRLPGGPMSAPHDPWNDAKQYAWTSPTRLIEVADRVIATLRAQNADYVEQHGKVTRCLAARTVERDALRSTVDQQQARITELERALGNILAPMCSSEVDTGVVRQKMLVVAGDYEDAFALYTAARQALETP